MLIESEQTLRKATLLLEMLVRIRVSRGYDQAEQETEGLLPSTTAHTASEFVAARSREELAQELHEEGRLLEASVDIGFSEIADMLALDLVGEQLHEALIAQLE